MNLPNCDTCGRFTVPGSPGTSWVHVPACDIPGEFGDERDRCAKCTEKYGPAQAAAKYVAKLVSGTIPK
jgi:hypothetical protein